ncbi:MAG: hypothetical protein WAS21_07190 [Geminicoccaceae bacterium]
MTKLRLFHQATYAFSRLLVPISVAVATLVPGAASAQQKAMLEKSASYALDNNFRAFVVPIQDNLGNVKYYDVTVALTISPSGVVSPTAKVTATASPLVTSMVIPPGTYKASDGTLCTVANITTATGRIQSNFSCALSAVRVEFAVATGPVSAGHPFLTPLIAAKIDKLPEVGSKIWGVTLTNTSGAKIAGCGAFSTNPMTEIGAVTNGNIISLSLYSNNPAFKCGFNLTKQ